MSPCVERRIGTAQHVTPHLLVMLASNIFSGLPLVSFPYPDGLLMKLHESNLILETQVFLVKQVVQRVLASAASTYIKLYLKTKKCERKEWPSLVVEFRLPTLKHIYLSFKSGVPSEHCSSLLD